ncbi:MAG: type II secretion system F family protein [Candidatus Kerfeldbacteria bacterium]|nr:type II secretion system F family protein [Candidatus Kerfeldbacteria bacterium]
MAEYQYTARTPEGKLVKDRMRAKSTDALADDLKNKGLILTQAKEMRPGGGTNFFQSMMNSMSGVPIVDKIFFTQNLSIMVKTGFSLSQALKTLSAQTSNKKFKGIIDDIRSDVESGAALSNSLQRFPKVFPEIFVNMISAGEASGKLDEILITLTNQMKKDHQIVSKVRAALTYPSIVIFAMIVIGVVMMVTVVPQLLSVFDESTTELPVTTKILVAFSDLLKNYLLYVVGFVAVLAVAFLRFRKTKSGKKLIHATILKLPLISPVVKKVNLARFTRTLSSLLKTDIPIVQTMQIISKVLGNVHYSNAVLIASEQVKKGVSIVKTLENESKLFPPIVTQMISVGEESGTLDSITEEIADFYEEDVDQTLNTLSSVIEPILMLFIGGAVAFLALSVLQPMYGLVEAI